MWSLVPANKQRMRDGVGDKALHRALFSRRDDLATNDLIELGIIIQLRDGSGQRLGVGMTGDDARLAMQNLLGQAADGGRDKG